MVVMVARGRCHSRLWKNLPAPEPLRGDLLEKREAGRPAGDDQPKASAKGEGVLPLAVSAVFALGLGQRR